MKKINKDDFCYRSHIKHNNKYDYSLVEYKNNRTKVNIVCKIHGVFEQIPDSHMRGVGCPKCSGNHNYSNEEFINKVKLLFGDKYLYNKIKYTSQKDKVILVCEKHGDIEKYPQVLLKGSGCSKCESKNYKIDTSEFIIRAKKIHKNKFNYKYVSYINDCTAVKIECVRHGIFEQTPNIHLSGHGCIVCSGRYKSSNVEFIEKSILIHGYKYDYSDVDYENAHKKINIICNKHGVFKQKPNCHLSGRGCPSCKESKGEILINEILTKKNIKFDRQKTFESCKNKSLLFFDFYLPDKNICIEYDGEFHFQPIFGKQNLLKTKHRDKIKNRYCKENNINLIRISYKDFNSIENIINSMI